MVLILAVIESQLRARPDLTNEFAEIWRSKRSVASREATTCEVLCFGDSLVQFGVLPNVLEARLGCPSYNLALPAGSPLSSYFLLRRSIEAGARLRAVVVDFTPFQLSIRATFDSVRRPLWPELAGGLDLLDLAFGHDDPSLAGATLLAQVLPSYRSRQGAREAILAGFRNPRLNFVIGKLLATRRNLLRNRGSWVIPAGSRVADTACDMSDLAMKAHEPSIVRFIDLFLRLANSHGTAVYWVIPPISPEYQAWNEQEGTDARFTAFVRAKQAEFPGLIVIDGRRSGYDPSLFCDRIHLNRRGASVFSDDLAFLLANPPSNHWEQLPSYRERSVPGRVEDDGESWTAIAKPFQLRR